MSDGSLVTMDAVGGSGEVTQFTVDSSAATVGGGAVAGVAITQVSVAPAGGTGFILTPDTDNISPATASLQYSEDGGATYRNIGSATLINATADVADPAAVLIGDGVYYQVLVSGGGSATSLSLWTAHAGA